MSDKSEDKDEKWEMENGSMDNKFFHKSVLVNEVLSYLINDRNGLYVDATLGGGGHSEKILSNTNAKIIAIDLDDNAINFAKNRLSNFAGRIDFIKGNFCNINQLLQGLKVNGVLFDLGVSSYQIDTEERGFSFSGSGKLDMRMDTKQNFSAYDIINGYREEELARIFFQYGEEKFSKRIARAIIKEKSKKRIETTEDLANIIEKVVSGRYKIKTLARIFQALRIEVNGELENLKNGLSSAFEVLKNEGRIVVISYHSLEDRIVKNFFKNKEKNCICSVEMPICVCGKKSEMKILTKKAVIPYNEEVEINPRSRSAKLRAGRKLWK
jgi:16S rRNA (cytosine1402-N4)-methyltransferase